MMFDFRLIIQRFILSFVIFVFVFLLNALASPHSEFVPFKISGKVIHIADGDTITILISGNRQVKIRLYGIDCPEKKQSFGQQARRFTADRVGNRDVQVEIFDTDRYGRTVGIVKTDDGGILNRELLINGLAWIYMQYCTAPFCAGWKQEEMQARQMKIGLWSDKNVMEPWEFRKQKKMRYKNKP